MLKLHKIPVEFTDLATIYEAPAYQLQFIGAGISLDVYARSIEELFGAFALIRDNYIIKNSDQELRFYQLTDADGWQNLGGLYGAEIEHEGVHFDEFRVLLEGADNE